MSRMSVIASGSIVAAVVASTLAAAPAPQQTETGPDQQHGTSASFDFDDGLQGWTVQDTEVADCAAVINDGIEQPEPSTWQRLPDTDGFDDRQRGEPRRDPGDHHMAVDEYRNCSDTRLVSPVLDGDGSPVTLEFQQRHWTEDNWDFLHVEWRSGQDGAWQRLDSCHGRGRYPAWNTVTTTFSPDTSFQVSFWFTSDESFDSSVMWRLERQLLATTRSGLGAWVDDVGLARGEAAAGPCVYGEPDDSTGSEDSQRRHRTEADSPGTSPTSAPTPPPEPSTGTGIGGHDVLVDRMGHPEYQAMTTAVEMRLNRVLTDPYRWDWDGSRGRMRDVWVVNRYDTPLAATMYAPLQDGRYPAIVFIGGYPAGDFPGYSSLLQRLAAEGYVVLSVSPQGVEFDYGERTSPITPARRFCGDQEETADEWWRQPQEAGLTETEYCAGMLGDQPPYDCAGDLEYPGCNLVDPRTGNGQHSADHLNDLYQDFVGPSYTFAPLDAIDWLTSPANPWRHLVDPQRIGTAGHSAGGFGAMVAANTHPDVSAAVALDQYGRWPEGLDQLGAPVLVIGTDNAVATAGMPDPGDGSHGNQRAVVHGLRDAGVDTGWLVLRDTEHNDFVYLRYPSRLGALAFQSSRWAIPVTHHYMLAWFDHHLKGLPDARGRLLDERFDHIADRTATGVGRWDPILGNVPYRIARQTVADHLSGRFPTANWIHLDGETTDLR